jgi:alanine racemase
MRARVDLVKPVRRGDGIGYGHRYVYDRDGYVATLPVGWVDGIPRGLTNRGEVLIKGRRCKVVGIVSMNHTMVDVSDICGEVKRGDIATLIGTDGRDRISVQEVAHRAGTSAHELLVRLGRDLPRLYK